MSARSARSVQLWLSFVYPSRTRDLSLSQSLRSPSIHFLLYRPLDNTEGTNLCLCWIAHSCPIRKKSSASSQAIRKRCAATSTRCSGRVPVAFVRFLNSSSASVASFLKDYTGRQVLE